ncbi:MAG: hypothetical protein RLZZ142_1856 [Verrucomicrobiota bacterium]
MFCSKKSMALWAALPVMLVAPAWAEVKLPNVFSPHMVLQRERPVPIWGTASPGEKVEVRFRDQVQSVEANGEGKWKVTLKPLEAGGPDVLQVGGVRVEDVLVGEVWVGSGQSNMDMMVRAYTAGDAALEGLAKESYPQIRLLRKGAASRWSTADPANNGEFSAQLFAFGVALQKKLGVPVGLMVGAVGGTPSGFWLTEEMYRADAACQELVKKMAPTYDYEGLHRQYLEQKAKWEGEMAEWNKVADAAKKEGKEAPRAPKAPPAVGKAGEVNSGKMGSLFEAFIRPYVGYAIRGVLWDQGESRTNVACVDQFTLMGALVKGWRKEWGQDFPFLYVQKPSGGGIAWDPAAPMAAAARKLQPEPPQVPSKPEVADYSHELHLRIREHPNTFMVTSSDLGPGVHPVLKSAYGERGAQVAMAAVYGAKHAFYGPLYTGHRVEGSRVRLAFSHVGQGLAPAQVPKLQGFAIAGADRKFVWGEAVIEGDTVVVSSPSVPNPESVRYAWSETFPWANLFNKDGLPAQPFRTDSW